MMEPSTTMEQVLVRQLQTALGQKLHGVLRSDVFRPRRGEPPPSFLFLIEPLDAAALDAMAATLPPLQWEHSFDWMVSTPAQIQRAADCFPVRFLLLQRHHARLHGEDPFVGVEISRKHLRLRVEQELRNLLSRLRRRYVMQTGDGTALLQALSDVTPAVLSTLWAFLEIQDLTCEPDSRSVVAAATEQIADPAHALEAMEKLWSEQVLPAEPKRVFLGLLSVLETATARIDRMETSH